jgi:hypothetical protein
MDNIIPYRPKPKPVVVTGNERVTSLNYDAMALKFAQSSGLSEFPVIVPGTPEWIAWQRYFDGHLRWQPWIFKAIASGQKTQMTVPTQWPEWFDSSFVGSESA